MKKGVLTVLLSVIILSTIMAQKENFDIITIFGYYEQGGI